MKIFSIIGIDPLHYENIKHTIFIEWILKHAKTDKECHLCFQDKRLQKYFLAELSSINIRFVTHLQMFKKPQSTQQKLALYFDYLKKFDMFFPHGLKPNVKNKDVFKYEYN